MKTPLRSSLPLRLTTVCAAATLFCGGMLQAASLPNRLNADAANTAPQPLARAVSARIQSSTNLGHLRGDMPLQTMSLVLAPSAAQSAALDQLLAAQQDPTSAQYHQWLTPEQFGQRFGVSDSDLAVLQNWLTSQGLQVESVAPSRNGITFSGTAGTVEAAFHMQLDRFSRHGQDFFENSTAPELPSAFQGVVASVTGLSSYRLQPQVRTVRTMTAQGLTTQSMGATPSYTSASGNHYIAPSDWRTIYNAAPLYSSGYNGTGIKIAVLGQTAVNTTQITYFQQLTGQTVKLPTMVLVPNSGTSTVYQGDETESEADLEVASGVAPGATVLFVYTGNSTTTGVFGALDYAITNNLAPILTLSYGGCEVEQTSNFLAGQEIYLRQANAQGQTFVASSGDSGAAACDANDATTSYEGLQVNYPASSMYTTGVGGTQFAENGNASAYWSSSNNAAGGSALGYIPESVWNESSVSPVSLSSGGGGFSRMFGKPNWQSGTGVPADGARDVPDISFSAAGHDAYLFCTADPSYSSNNATGACTATSFGSLSVVAGTSLSTPSFAGALALVESARGGNALGNINRFLYVIAAGTPSVFHDVTTGSNSVPCVSGSLGCVNGTLGYSATAGYDLASGLGSMDINAFSNGLATAATATAQVPTVSITPGSATTASITVNLAVTPGTTASATPSGTVSVTLDGGTPQTATLSNGTATTTFTSTAGFSVGTHTVAATYNGDTNYTAATSSLRVTVAASNSGLSLAVTPATLTINSSSAHSGVYTLAATSTNGYAGVIYIYASGGPSSGCFLGSDASVAANTTINIPVTYSFLASDCTSSGTTTANRVLPAHAALTAPTGLRPTGSARLPVAALAFTGLFGIACIRRRRAAWNAWMTGLLALTCLLGTAALSGCGSGTAPLSQSTTGGSGTTTGSAVKGTYNVKFTITDYTGTISSSQTVSLVIQ